MSEQEMQKKMEFIVAQQAKNAVEIEKLLDAHAKAEARLSNHDLRIDVIEGALANVMALMSDLMRAQNHLTKTQDELTKTQDELTKTQDELIKTHIATEEKLNRTGEKVDALTDRIDVFINMMVERTLKEKNGNGSHENN